MSQIRLRGVSGAAYRLMEATSDSAGAAYAQLRNAIHKATRLRPEQPARPPLLTYSGDEPAMRKVWEAGCRESSDLTGQPVPTGEGDFRVRGKGLRIEGRNRFGGRTSQAGFKIETGIELTAPAVLRSLGLKMVGTALRKSGIKPQKLADAVAAGPDNTSAKITCWFRKKEAGAAVTEILKQEAQRRLPGATRQKAQPWEWAIGDAEGRQVVISYGPAAVEGQGYILNLNIYHWEE